jgi:NADPH:quinone reductase-like Zn-dependent oxidoreductase
VVTYAEPSWGDPVDVVLDAVGGELLGRGVEALAPFGRLVAFSAGRLDPRHADLPFDQIAKAVDLVAARRNLGRVVLRIR